jgi:hypothetical protein
MKQAFALPVPKSDILTKSGDHGDLKSKFSGKILFRTTCIIWKQVICLLWTESTITGFSKRYLIIPAQVAV